MTPDPFEAAQRARGELRDREIQQGPRRIQLSRAKGWRKPPGAIVVARPSRWGNPFRIYRCDCCGHWDVIDDNGVTYLIDHPVARISSGLKTGRPFAQREAVRLFAEEAFDWFGGRYEASGINVADLRGHDLACWCPLVDEHGQRVPCHADVLLELANS